MLAVLLAIGAASDLSGRGVHAQEAAPAECASAALSPPPPATSEPSMSMSGAQQVQVTGWFTTIWGRETIYSVTDDQGKQTRLHFDPELTRPLGGPPALDRKRVTVAGEVVSDDPAVLRVLAIDLAPAP